jgi:hypothetical protein
MPEKSSETTYQNIEKPTASQTLLNNLGLTI